jgi:hypothetical protein
MTATTVDRLERVIGHKAGLEQAIALLEGLGFPKGGQIIVALTAELATVQKNLEAAAAALPEGG